MPNKQVVSVILLLLIGCGSRGMDEANTTPGKSSSIPEWYLNPPQEDGIVYGVGCGTSRDQQIALTKARHRAATEIAKAAGGMIVQTLEVEIAYSGATDSTRVHSFIKSVSNQATAYISGFYVERYFFATDGTCYVLAGCPLSGIQEVAIEEMQSKEELLEELGLESSLQDLIRVIRAMR